MLAYSKKMKTFLLLLFVSLSVTVSAGNRITVKNFTGQRILKIEYWIGPENLAQSPGLIYKSKGSIEKDDSLFSFEENFHKKKRNTILIKASLFGGGYLTNSYSIGENQTEVNIPLYNPSENVPTDNFQTIIDKFKEFKFDKEYLKLTNQNALLSTLGALYLLDASEKSILYIITPKELKTQLNEICKHNNQDFAQGTLSSSTAVSGGLNLPFVSVNSAFSNGDVSKFTWTIENAGECIWAPIGDKDLASLYSELSQKTKDALLQAYIDNPNSKLKFINKLFVIGRIEVETIKSKKVSNNIELTGSSFVTAKGNFSLDDEHKTKNVITDVVTRADGHYVTGYLANQYLLSVASAKKIASEFENNRLKEEFIYLVNLYPDLLTHTNDLELMKKQIVDLNKKLGGLYYLKKSEGSSSVTLKQVSEQNQGVGDIKSTINN